MNVTIEVTDDFVQLVGELEIWNRGDGIAEVGDKSSRLSTVFIWVHGDRRLEFDDKGKSINSEPLSAFPGHITSQHQQMEHMVY